MDTSNNSNRLALVMMSVIAGVGAILAVVVITTYVGFLIEKKEDEAERAEWAVEEQDDSKFYKDLKFSESNSNTPLLVYTAVRNNEIVDMNLLTEFREVSENYISKYDGIAIPTNATFDTITVVDTESALYPYPPLKRIMINTSEGCARFDFYEDLLVVHDYELINKKCTEVGDDWNYLLGHNLDEL